MSFDPTVYHSALPIVVRGTVINEGLGDISSAFSIARALFESGIDHSRILVSIKDAASEKDIERFNTAYKFRILSTDEVMSISDVALRIFIPCGDDHLFTRYKEPSLWISEYAHNSSSWNLLPSTFLKSISLGINERNKEFGIFIDKDLAAFAFSEESLASRNRLLKLKEASLSTQGCLLGAAYSEEAVDAFNARKQFYFGYAHFPNSLMAFILSIAILNRANEKTPVIWVLNDKIVLPASFLHEVKDLGYGKIEMVHSPESTKELILDPSKPKCLRVVFREIPYADVCVLWKASEKESIATGDKSFSEAVSSNKAFAYEALVHKCDLGEAINTLHRDFSITFKDHDTTHVRSLAERLLRIYNQARSEGYESFTKMNRNLIENFNFSRKFKSLIEDFAPMRVVNFEEGEEIPYETPLFLTLNQVWALKIDTKTNLSESDRYKGYHLKTERICNNVWVLFRPSP